MSKSLEVLMVIVFSPPQVPIDTFITSIVQIFREIELMYYNFFREIGIEIFLNFLKYCTIFREIEF